MTSIFNTAEKAASSLRGLQVASQNAGKLEETLHKLFPGLPQNANLSTMTDEQLMGLPNSGYTQDHVRNQWSARGNIAHPNNNGGESALFRMLEDAFKRIMQKNNWTA